MIIFVNLDIYNIFIPFFNIQNKKKNNNNNNNNNK